MTASAESGDLCKVRGGRLVNLRCISTAATTALLREHGHRVVTVDLRGADVVADLATREGRAAVVAGVQAATDVVHGLVPGAGIAGLTGVDPALVVSVNFFGAITLLRGLRPQLAAAGGSAVVLLSSNSVTAQPGWAADVATACLDDDEDAARAAASGVDAVTVYPATKADAYPSALGRPGTAEEVAATIGFLLSDASRLMVGSVVFVDGGTDALLHPLRPEGMDPTGVPSTRGGR